MHFRYKSFKDYLSLYTSIYPSTHQSIHQSSIYLFICLSTFLSLQPSNHPSTHPPTLSLCKLVREQIFIEFGESRKDPWGKLSLSWARNKQLAHCTLKYQNLWFLFRLHQLYCLMIYGKQNTCIYHIWFERIWLFALVVSCPKLDVFCFLSCFKSGCSYVS